MVFKIMTRFETVHRGKLFPVAENIDLRSLGKEAEVTEGNDF